MNSIIELRVKMQFIESPDVKQNPGIHVIVAGFELTTNIWFFYMTFVPLKSQCFAGWLSIEILTSWAYLKSADIDLYCW